MSDQILNGRSAQLGYTATFTLAHAGQYGTEDKSRTDTT